jgi:hypothetical protein
MVFGMNIVCLACETLNVDWGHEDEALFVMAQLLTVESPKEVQRATARLHYSAYDLLSKILCGVVNSTGCAEAIKAFLNVTTLDRIAGAIRKSDNFMSLLVAVEKARPDLLRPLERFHLRFQQVRQSKCSLIFGISLTLGPIFFSLRHRQCGRRFTKSFAGFLAQSTDQSENSLEAGGSRCELGVRCFQQSRRTQRCW